MRVSIYLSMCGLANGLRMIPMNTRLFETHPIIVSKWEFFLKKTEIFFKIILNKFYIRFRFTSIITSNNDDKQGLTL